MADVITVTGLLLDSQNQPMGGRRVIADGQPQHATVDSASVRMLSKAWSAADGTFSLVCVKASGVIYTIQTWPERLLPSYLELRCNDWAAGSVVSVTSLPQALPSSPAQGVTLAELEAQLEAYVDTVVHTVSPFSDPRAAVTAGPGTMGLPNATGRALTIVGVVAHAGIAPTGADLVVDVHNDGVTIFTDQNHRPRVLAGATDGSAPTIDAGGWAPGNVLTVDVDQVGSTNPGGYLTVAVIVQG